MNEGPVLATGPLLVVNVSGHVIFTHAFDDTLRSWGDADASAVRAALYGVILASLSPRSSGAGLGTCLLACRSDVYQSFRSSAGVPTPAGKQPNGDPAATLSRDAAPELPAESVGVEKTSDHGLTRKDHVM